MGARTMKAHFGRRAILAMTAVVAGALALPVEGISAPKGELVYLGMHGAKIHAARLDTKTGTLALIGPVAENKRPTWGLRHPKLPVIYFNEEAGNDGKGEGGVMAFRVDVKTGALTKISDVRAGGGGTTHLWLDQPSMTLFAVNYGGGSMATIPVNADGSLGEVTSLTRFEGSGPINDKAARIRTAFRSILRASGCWSLIWGLTASGCCHLIA